MAKLKVTEQALLRYPPTPTTWACRRKLKNDGVEYVCSHVNTGRAKACVFCGTSKPARPNLLWPLYVAACSKAGIEPGTRWPTATQTTTADAPKKTVRRKGA